MRALPAMGVPGLTVSTGLVGTCPVGVQIVAGRSREDLCLRAGYAIGAVGTPPAPIDPSNRHKDTKSFSRGCDERLLQVLSKAYTKGVQDRESQIHHHCLATIGCGRDTLRSRSGQSGG